MSDEKVSKLEEAGGDGEAARHTQDVDAAGAGIKHHIDADEALRAFSGLDPDRLVLDAETERRLLRKIDLNIMPVLALRAVCAVLETDHGRLR